MPGLLKQLNRRSHRRSYRSVLLGLLGFLLCGLLGYEPGRSVQAQALPRPGITQATPQAITQSIAQVKALGIAPGDQEQQGRERYEAGQFARAIALWSEVVEVYQAEGDRLNQARVMSNLAAAYQQLGQWQEAEAALDRSRNLLQTLPSDTPEHRLVLAQVLNTQGSLQLALGQAEQALSTWQQATHQYTQIRDSNGITLSLINQAQAMKSLGLYRRALTVLTQVSQQLQQEPDSLTKLVGLRSLGTSLRVLGDLEQAEQVLQRSLTIAQRLNLPSEQATLFFSLGNVSRAQKKPEQAIALYQQAAARTPVPLTKLQAQVNQFSLLLEQQQVVQAQNLLPKIQAQLAQLAPSRMVIYARLNLAYNLIRARSPDRHPLNTTQLDIARFLATTVRQAQELGDRRAYAYALGTLGSLYEQTQQWQNANDLTQRALLLAQSINAPEVAYLWQWQLGRILKAQGDVTGAIVPYGQAVTSLQSLRSDLVTSNPEVQFTFRDGAEPVYRELVSLLLQPGRELSQEVLLQARQVMESLQLAELDDFFQEACLDAQKTQTDQVDPQAAVFYPIILPDRLEVILSLPGQPLHHYTIAQPERTIDTAAEQLQQTLVVRSERDYLPIAQQLYNWLIRPIAADLANSNVKTLVFVLDGSLRNIPMATLHDGKQFLVEQYEIALTPGLQLFTPKRIQQTRLRVLSAGLTEARQGFSPLENVGRELEQIQSNVTSTILLNQAFTRTNLQNQIQSTSYPIVHIATHGKFSSEAAETFILAWDERINVKQISRLLQPSGLSESQAIEMLVLSACETAVGDKRATLGLAGVAVQAGARSTVASLWSVNDEATTELMSQFYKNLTTRQDTKAAALRQAQLTLLKNPQFQHPIYWGPYILVGNWL